MVHAATSGSPLPGATILRRHPAVLAAPGFALALCLLIFYLLPPWGIPVWLIVVTAVCAIAALTAAIYRRGSKRRGPAAGGISVRPRTWPIVIHALLLLGCLVYVLVAGQAVIAASLLGPHPAETTATQVLDRSCSRCNPRVQYDVGAEVLTATLGSNLGTPTGTPELVYDPTHPFHVMTRADWDAGRGSARYGVLGVVLGAAAWLSFWIWISTRRARIGAGLHPDVPVAAAQRQVTKRGLDRWRVRFADGRRFLYADTLALRQELLLRLNQSGALGTLPPPDRELLLRTQAERPSTASGSQLPTAPQPPL